MGPRTWGNEKDHKSTVSLRYFPYNNAWSLGWYISTSPVYNKAETWSALGENLWGIFFFLVCYFVECEDTKGVDLWTVFEFNGSFFSVEQLPPTFWLNRCFWWTPWLYLYYLVILRIVITRQVLFSPTDLISCHHLMTWRMRIDKQASKHVSSEWKTLLQ